MYVYYNMYYIVHIHILLIAFRNIIVYGKDSQDILQHNYTITRKLEIYYIVEVHITGQ